jgi:hypothetical protein
MRPDRLGPAGGHAAAPASLSAPLERRAPRCPCLMLYMSPTEMNDDELVAHLLGLRAALLDAADEGANDAAFDDIAGAIKGCQAEVERRGLG